MRPEAHRADRATEEPSALAMPLWTFFCVWIVCAAGAAISWNNLVTNTPTAGTPLSITFPELLVLSITFGLPGAALINFACGVFSER
jgi:hypothetical protein